MKEALFYEKLKDNMVRCKLCFHECKLDNSQKGFCLVRRNVRGTLVADTYGKVVASHLDPIEKKPLYHFHPGEAIFSIAGNGCNLACPFCQNIEISRNVTSGKEMTPQQLIATAQSRASKGIAYTYTEPLVWYEFLLDTCKEARKAGLYNVIVSNGNINQEPLEALLPYIDAANIDLKGNEKFYREVAKGSRDSALNTIKALHRAGIHVEITYLLISGINDSARQVKETLTFIEDLDKRIPLHISRYFPYGSYNIPPTPVKAMLKVYEQARTVLPYVYLGNVVLIEGQNTHCPECGVDLVKRMGYGVEISNIKKNQCAKCGRKVDLVL